MILIRKLNYFCFFILYSLCSYSHQYNTQNILFLTPDEALIGALSNLILIPFNPEQSTGRQISAREDFARIDYSLKQQLRLDARNILLISDGNAPASHFPLHHYYWGRARAFNLTKTTLVWTDLNVPAEKRISSEIKQPELEISRCYANVDNRRVPWGGDVRDECTAKIRDNFFDLILMRRGLCFCILGTTCPVPCARVEESIFPSFLDKMSTLLKKEDGHAIAFFEGMNAYKNPRDIAEANLLAIKHFLNGVDALNKNTSKNTKAKIVVMCLNELVKCEISEARVLGVLLVTQRDSWPINFPNKPNWNFLPLTSHL